MNRWIIAPAVMILSLATGLQAGPPASDKESHSTPGRAATVLRLPHLASIRGAEHLYTQAELIEWYGRECGIICLTYILRHHGSRLSYSDVSSKFQVSPRGVSIAQLRRAAEQLGMKVRSLRIKPQDLAQVSTPCILHTKGDGFSHFVLLLGMREEGFVILDPSLVISGQGKSVRTFEEVSKSFSGVVVEIAPRAQGLPSLN